MPVAGMQFSVSTLIAGFVFGIFGIFIFRDGKKESNFRRLMIGLVLLVYGFFVTNPWLAWGLGLFLVWLNYFTAWTKGG